MESQKLNQFVTQVAYRPDLQHPEMEFGIQKVLEDNNTR